MTAADSGRRFGVWHALALAMPWGVAVAAATRKISDNSFLWHIRAGTVQIANGSVITADPFSFTAAGRPWRTQSWLADVLYGFLESQFGLDFVPWYVFLAGILFFGAVLLAVWSVLRSPVRVAVFMAATTIVAAAFLNPRPAILSFGLFALVVLADRDPRLRWALPLIVWVWASVHGSFVLGGLFLLLQTLRRREWRRWREAPAMFAAVLATAHGWGVVDMLAAFAGAGEALDQISEWEHPDLLSLPMLPFTLLLLALLAAATAGRLRPADLWIAAPFLVVAFSANRSVVPAWIAMLPVSPATVTLLPPVQGVIGSALPRRLWAGITVAAGVLTAVSLSGGSELDRTVFPVQAASELRSSRVFHSDGTGGYLIYAQWPDRRVYIDDRAELFTAKVPEFVGARAGLPKWREVFAREGLREALLRENDPLTEILRASGWVTGYRGEGFVLLRIPAAG